MACLIGIIMRDGISQTGKKIGISYNDIVSSVIKSGGIPVVIPNDNINYYLGICSGFILQGGDDVSKNNLEILKLLKKKNIPVLGICLGMQEMAVMDSGKLFDIPNHNNGVLHEALVGENTLLYRILGSNKILVNSRHTSAVRCTDLTISSLAIDGVIESVEDDKLRFYLGLQWHPENMYDDDANSRKIFDYFIKVCNDSLCK